MTHTITRRRTEIRRSRRPLVSGTLVLIGLLGLVACGRASAEDPPGYLAKNKNRIVFIEWTASSAAPSSAAGAATSNASGSSTGTVQTLQGTATVVMIDRKHFHLNSDLASFAGTLNGSSVVLNMAKPLDSASTWFGTLTGSQLTLTYTDGDGNLVTLGLQSATRSAFRVAILTQQQALLGIQTNSASNKTEDQLKADIDKYSKLVTEDMAMLATDVAAAAALVPAISSANSSTNSSQRTASHALNQAKKYKYGPQICPFASQASAAASSASGAAASASASNDQLNALVSTARKQISKLQDDDGNLASALAALPSYKPKGLPTDKQVTDSISSANTGIADALHSGNGAARTAGSKAASAQSAAASAQSLCAAAPQVKPSPTGKK